MIHESDFKLKLKQTVKTLLSLIQILRIHTGRQMKPTAWEPTLVRAGERVAQHGDPSPLVD